MQLNCCNSVFWLAAVFTTPSLLSSVVLMDATSTMGVLGDRHLLSVDCVQIFSGSVLFRKLHAVRLECLNEAGLQNCEIVPSLQCFTLTDHGDTLQVKCCLASFC